MGVPDATGLSELVATTVISAIGHVLPELAEADPVVRASEHADYQSNAALALAKRTRQRPADLAAAIARSIEASGSPSIGEVTVSGPGFINVTLTDTALWGRLTHLRADERLGVGTPETGRTTVVDYSGVNIAKEMHVGHLRTTIIGDCLVRVLGFLGGDVLRRNHLGDWGTQFGMLIEYLAEHPDAAWHRDQIDDGTSAVSKLDALYKDARAAFDSDEQFAERARARVVALQAGDEATVELWREIVAESEASFGEVYARLGVLLTSDDSFGESYYNAMLDDVVDELTTSGIAVESDGALVVPSEEVMGPDGSPAVLIVRKRDGGYGYDTTDLATLRHRVKDLNADRLLYVVDARQALHFRLVFEAGRRAGWLSAEVEAVHISYGTVLGPDGRPFKTRSGDTVRLMELLDSAVERAQKEIANRADDFTSDELSAIAEAAGIGAVKYAELSTSRTKDYSFDVDRMVSFTGNTGVYLQYAHARICSILRRAGSIDDVPVVAGVRPEPAERALLLHLDRFDAAVRDVVQTFEPHRLCVYLFDLAKAFTSFYEACPVLQADTEEQRANRLALTQVTGAALKRGLDLLGIQAPDRM